MENGGVYASNHFLFDGCIDIYRDNIDKLSRGMAGTVYSIIGVGIMESEHLFIQKNKSAILVILFAPVVANSTACTLDSKYSSRRNSGIGQPRSRAAKRGEPVRAV